MRARPLSPHLTIYRMRRYSLLSSFANRLSGLALSAGLLLLLYWLVALSRGARAYAHAQEWLSAPLARLVYLALIASFCYHLVAGIRHLVWDTGRGLEKAQSQRSAWLIIGAALVLTVLCALWAFRVREAL